MSGRIGPSHPGEILAQEFLKPFGLSQYRLAKNTSVSGRRINEIVQGKRAISADTALRLAKYFGTSELFWLNLQARYELEVERLKLHDRLDREVQILQLPRERAASKPAEPNTASRAKLPRSPYVRKVK
jgi:addiction module HigA family antidote